MEDPAEQQQRRQSLERTPVPPYEAWPSVPKSALDVKVLSEKPNVMDLDNVMSPTDRYRRSASVLSMDDFEAAKALEGLRTDFKHSPTRSVTLLPDRPSPQQSTTTESSTQEPLLSLITSQHPLLSTTINASLSAYSSSKSYSPRFKYGAEFVERNIASPVANTVGTAGRITGVETGVRWIFQRSDSQSTPEDRSNKRRRIDDDEKGREMDVEKGLGEVSLYSGRQRASSSMSYSESLPAYDAERSPSYEEQGPMVTVQRGQQSPNSRNWQTRLMMSTSGLGVALSEESLRSLKYCLSWLKWANSHLGGLLVSLHNVLEEWSRHRQSQSSDKNGETNGESRLQQNSRPARDQATITQHIQALKGECLKTLKDVVDTISRYAGGALPENARILVRRHLTSLPQRFRIASTSQGPKSSNEKQSETSDVVSSAQRVVVLANEGLAMMAQVSDIVNGTIVSAEEWCDRLGKRRERSGERHTADEGRVQQHVNGYEQKEGLMRRDQQQQLQTNGFMNGHDEKEQLRKMEDVQMSG